jgi:hypothetical protein
MRSAKPVRSMFAMIVTHREEDEEQVQAIEP